MQKKIKGKHYICPTCKSPLRPDETWDVLHCIECKKSIDLWYDPVPQIEDGDVEPYKPEWMLFYIMHDGPAMFTSGPELQKEPPIKKRSLKRKFFDFIINVIYGD